MKPKFKIELSPQEISPGKSGWDSEQFSVLLKIIDTLVNPFYWCAADVWYVANNPAELTRLKNEESGSPYFIGDTKILLVEVMKTNYFYSGIFLGYKSNINESGKFFTEDEEWRDIGKAEVEVRLFDTSIIEVYSLDQTLLSQIVSMLSLKKKIHMNSDYIEGDSN